MRHRFYVALVTVAALATGSSPGIVRRSAANSNVERNQP